MVNFWLLTSSSFMVLILSWFHGYLPLRKLVSGLLPAGGEGGLHKYSPLEERVGFMVTSHWGSWFYGYFPLGKLVSGLLPTGGEGGFYGYFPLGKLVFGFFPALGKLVSGLLPAGGQGGLHEYSPLEERVGCMVTSRWVSEVIICECNSCLSVLLCFFLWLFCLPILFACGIFVSSFIFILLFEFISLFALQFDAVRVGVIL